MLKWNSSILTTWNNPEICWWCGSHDLSREHKYKKTDIDLLYGKSPFPKYALSLLKYKKSINPIPVQSSTSDYLKFDKSLCKTCNNAKSSKMDRAYSTVIEYYLVNRDKIKDAKSIDFQLIFGKLWMSGKEDFLRYCVKHVGSRLVDCGISPSKNMVDFLDGKDFLKDILFVFQLKRYSLEVENEEIPIVYAGPFNAFEQKHLLIGTKMTAVASWYTVKQFSINYLYRKGVLDLDNILKSPQLKIDVIDFSKMTEINPFSKNSLRSPSQEFGEFIEKLECFPFTGQPWKIDHYNYLLQSIRK